MKRFLSLVLTLAMAFALAVPALAAEVTPTPPAWVKAEEYAVFADGAAYTPENWGRIQRLRADAAAGNAAPNQAGALYDDYTALKRLCRSDQTVGASLAFELSLIELRYRCNMIIKPPAFSQAQPSPIFSRAAEAGAGQEPQVYRARLWELRTLLVNFADLDSQSLDDMNTFVQKMEAMYDAYPRFQPATVTDWDMAKIVPAEYRQMVEDGMIVVTLDGKVVHPAVLTNSPIDHEASFARVRNGWTMVPVRRLAELMGAQVSYNNGKVTIVRAGTTIVMTIGSSQASVNGAPLQMVTAPIKENGRTYIPIRYIGEFFGQKLTWVSPHRLAVTEDKTLAGASNLEAWALPMGAMLSQMNSGGVSGSQGPDRPTIFGGAERTAEFATAGGIYGYGSRNGALFGREIALHNLESGWGITDRAGLIETVTRMTAHGHNEDFLHDVAMIESWSAAEYQEVLRSAQGMDAYMFPYTKQLGQKWGGRGILCWDLFRMSSLVQWGYLAGYVTYPEALALLEPAASLLHDNFKSWDEAYENYLDGYNWWARNDVLGKNIWQTERGKLYQEMRADSEIGPIFNDSLFKQPVVGVPGLTAEGLAASVQ